MEPDLSTVAHEVAEAFARYEDALVHERNDELDTWFWDDPAIVRFGIAEIQYGPAAIAAWRRRAPHVGFDRTLRNTCVVPLGPDHAVVATEFTRPGRPTVGRQSQVWMRRPDGWRIVHAHVSVLDEADVEHAGTPQAR
jgi:hypothetical protein